MNPLPEINLEFLPDWARSPASSHAHVSEETTIPRQESRHRGEKHSQNRSRMEKGYSRKPSGQPSLQRRESELKIEVNFFPEQKNLESVIEQIRNTARAYPLFSLAKMFLEKPERHQVQLRFRSRKENHAQTAYQCGICEEVFLEKKAAMNHCLAVHLNSFYESQRQQGEALRGNFSSIASCQLDGTILGPTNHHTYQASLLKLYQTKFNHMPFERFKQSIQTVRDPEMIKKWLEETSWKTTYKSLHHPEEKLLDSQKELEEHFSKNHLQTTVREGAEFVFEGKISRQLKESGCLSAIRQAWED